MNLLLELEPRRRAFWSSVAAALRPVRPVRDSELGLWRDVFVRQGMPWGRFIQSVILHSGALALIYIVSLSWLRQQQIVATPEFDRASVLTYTPEEYVNHVGWGHSHYLFSLKIADEAGVKRLILFHHDQTHTDDKVDEILSKCLGEIRNRNYKFECIAAVEGMELEW